MSIFKKIFSSEAKVNDEDFAKQNQSKIKRSIFDFFQLDLKKIPDESFIEAEVETNSTGDVVRNYRKTLDYKECGIFDTVEVKIIGETGKNVFFKSFQPESVKTDHLKKLIDDLYLINGNDSSDKGKFTNKDLEDYKDTEFYMLFGRSWTDYPKHKYPVTVRRDKNDISISIWGVEKE